MLRHPGNPNLILHYGGTFHHWQIQGDKGPFIYHYLHRLHEVMASALSQYPRVFAFRFDVRFPEHMPLPDGTSTNPFITRFVDSFKAKIRHNRAMARQSHQYAHDTEVRYVWTREWGAFGRPHYHFIIFLNNDAFCTLGNFASGHNNIFHRLEAAWASALSLPLDAVSGLIHIPEHPVYQLRRDDMQGQADFFYRASYLCKAGTKEYGDGGHGFGFSRI